MPGGRGSPSLCCHEDGPDDHAVRVCRIREYQTLADIYGKLLRMDFERDTDALEVAQAMRTIGAVAARLQREVEGFIHE